MRTLYMHIGHHKTGSSFIQSALSKNIDNLTDHGIIYPISNNDRDLGLAGKISTGNAWGALETLESLEAWVDDNASNPADSILMSSENLFDGLTMLLDRERMLLPQDALEASLRKRGFNHVKILLFVRHPEDYYPSAWQQLIKRGGETRPIEALEHDIGFNYINAAGRMVTAFKDNTFFDLKLVNYTKTRNILVPVAHWIGLGEDKLIEPPTKVVNRSLTRSELEFIRRFNAELKERSLSFLPASFLSDALCNSLPDIEAEHTSLPQELADRLWKNIAESIAIINTELLEDERILQNKNILRRAVCEDMEYSPYCFSEKQIGVITDFMGESFQSYEEDVKVANKNFEIVKSQNISIVEMLEAERLKSQAKISTMQDIINQNTKLLSEVNEENRHIIYQLASKVEQLATTSAELKNAWDYPIHHLFKACKRRLQALRK